MRLLASRLAVATAQVGLRPGVDYGKALGRGPVRRLRRGARSAAAGARGRSLPAELRLSARANLLDLRRRAAERRSIVGESAGRERLRRRPRDRTSLRTGRRGRRERSDAGRADRAVGCRPPPPFGLTSDMPAIAAFWLDRRTPLALDRARDDSGEQGIRSHARPAPRRRRYASSGPAIPEQTASIPNTGRPATPRPPTPATTSTTNTGAIFYIGFTGEPGCSARRASRRAST